MIVGLLFDLVVPVDLGAEQAAEQGWHLDRLQGVVRSGLQQQHPDRGVLGEPVRQHTAGAARANNHEIKGLGRTNQWR